MTYVELTKQENTLHEARNYLVTLKSSTKDPGKLAMIKQMLLDNRDHLITLDLPDHDEVKWFEQLERDHRPPYLNPREEVELFEASDIVKNLYQIALNEQNEEQIARLYPYVAVVSKRPNYQRITQVMIDRARAHPIQLVLAQNRIEVLRGSCKCVFHNEDTGSMHIYPKTNSFFCFGCNEAGDVIKLYRHFTGCDFKSAVLALQ